MVDLSILTEPNLIEHLLAAFLRAMRVFAFVTGMLVVVDSCGLLLGVSEVPPHRPRANATAWLIAAVMACFASGWLLLRQVAWITTMTSVSDRLTASLVWAGWGISFTVRAVTRAKRPALTIWAAAGLCVFGTALALVSPVP